jgi:LuxR family transcriptional regulator, maltose regulon positive regulatory protein
VTATAAPPFGLIETKTTFPLVRPGAVRRDALIRRLEESTGAKLVSVAAAGGCGKTTLLAQWADDDPRPFAWLTVDERDNDPVLLLSYVLAALARADIVQPSVAGTAYGDVPSIWLTLVPEVCSTVSSSASRRRRTRRRLRSASPTEPPSGSSSSP